MALKQVRYEMGEACLAVRTGDADYVELARGVVVNRGGNLSQGDARVWNDYTGAEWSRQVPALRLMVDLTANRGCAGVEGLADMSCRRL